MVVVRSPKVQPTKEGRPSARGCKGVLWHLEMATCGVPMSIDIFNF